LPSGGSLNIVDNTIVFTSTKDGTPHARTFEIDATSFPKTMNLVAGTTVYGQGIYDFKGGNLVVCISPPADAPRPTEFAAPPGSKRVLMVMRRNDITNPTPTPLAAPPTTNRAPVQTVAPPNAPAATVTTVQQVQPNETVTTTTFATSALPPPPDVRVTSAVNGQIRTDAEILSMLPGTWQINDAYGALFLELGGNGTYSTFRETASTSTFQKVFSRVPVSSGTWNLSNGSIVFRCTSSSQPANLYKDHPFQVKSVTPAELVFIDYMGNLGRAVKVQ
jgi:hypothetical protein